MTKPAIKATGIVKQYKIGGAEQHYDSFRDMLGNVFKSPWKKFKALGGDVSKGNTFLALSDINFTINRGDVVGVIGHNGAGKSTLLKVLSQITAPTEGELTIYGSVASLLEVGTGFHPELTGRENIYLNGSILGMSRKQIDARFDEIVGFAEINEFLDTPVKRYSSGMYIRLAFSVAAHLDSDVLLVDEVLAVGDQKFQDKCLGMLGNASSNGRTVLFVSHNLASISKLCNKVMVLDHGSVVFFGDVIDGISHYNNQMSSVSVLSENDYVGELYPTIKFDGIDINRQCFSEGCEVDPFKDIEFSINVYAQSELACYRTQLSLYRDGQLVTTLSDSSDLSQVKAGVFKSVFTIPVKFLYPGEHTFVIRGVTDGLHAWVNTRHYRFNVKYKVAADYDAVSVVKGLVNLGVGKRVIEEQGNERS